MILSSKVSVEFAERVQNIATRLKVDVNHLMAVIAFETANTFAADICNGGKRWSALTGLERQHKAVGLIQFMPNTARILGTSSELLAGMKPEQQLYYVEKFFEPAHGRLQTIEDLYMWVLWPRAVGKSSDYVLFRRPSQTYEQNKGLDINNDGLITKQEASARVRKIYERGLTEKQEEKNSGYSSRLNDQVC